MRSKAVLLLVLMVAVFAGCSTTQEVTLAKSTNNKIIVTVSQVVDEGNSPQMDTNLEAALVKEGLTVRPKLPAGTARSKDVDALVSYVDVWRWDIVMYLRSLNVRLRDAETGDLIAMAQWTESPFHQFRGEGGVKAVVEKVVADLVAKVKALPKQQ